MSSETGYMICRLCGHKIKGNESPEICPACGAPKSSFIPYKEGASDKRLKILNLHLHSISTHFSVGFAIMLVLLFFINIFELSLFGINLGYGGVWDFFILIEPIFVVLTMIIGILDGKTRFNKVHTPFLKNKIKIGVVMIISSILVLVFNSASNQGSIIIYVVLTDIFIFIQLGAGGLLGKIGGQLTCDIVPMGKIIK